jgi:hypothetical protein
MKKVIAPILMILVLTIAGITGVCSSNANNSQNLENLQKEHVSDTPTPEPCNVSLSQALADNSWDISSSNPQADFRTRMGERFNSWPAGVITSIDCRLLKHGSPTGTFYVRVRRVSDDAILGTLGSKLASSLTTYHVWYTFNTSPVVIDTTEDIRISVEWDGGDSSNHINSPVYNSDVYSGGMLFEYNSSSSSYNDYSTHEWTWRNLTYSSFN